MRACLLTSYDAAYAECGDLALATFTAYAQKHHLNLEVIKDFDCGRPAPWAKIPLIAAMLNKGYDWVIWIDADALIIRADINILDQTKSNHDLYLTCHRLSENFLPGMAFSYDVPNTGVMIFKNSDWSKQFLENIWEEESFIHHYWWENAAVMKLLGYEFLLDTSLANRPNPEIMSHIGWLDRDFNSIPGVCCGKNPMVLHFAGQGNIAERSALMRKALGGQYASSPLEHLPLSESTLNDSNIADQGIGGKSPFMAATDALLIKWRQKTSLRLMHSGQNQTMAGPFKGLIWPKDYLPEPPMLIGCYEEELFPVIEEIIRLNPSRIVNIGAAEGYYATGLAKKLPHCQITTFEASQSFQRIAQEITELNNVSERIILKGFCHLQDLKDELTEPALLLVDCEGGEFELLNPELVPILRDCHILVEIHDFINPNISKEIMFRFAQSHDLTSIISKGRNTAFHSAVRRWDSFSQLMSVSEFRQGPMEWFWLKPKIVL